MPRKSLFQDGNGEPLKDNSHSDWNLKDTVGLSPLHFFLFFCFLENMWAVCFAIRNWQFHQRSQINNLIYNIYSMFFFKNIKWQVPSILMAHIAVKLLKNTILSCSLFPFLTQANQLSFFFCSFIISLRTNSWTRPTWSIFRLGSFTVWNAFRVPVSFHVLAT